MTCFTIGLDLGQSNDYSALVVAERVLTLPPGITLDTYYRNPSTVRGADVQEQFHVSAMRRWDLGTPYPSIVEDVTRLCGSDAMRNDALLVVDRSGVGAAVTDLLTERFMAHELTRVPPIYATITGGADRNGSNIPKADLIAGVTVPLQQNRLVIGSTLALASVIEQELLAFRQKITVSGNTSYDITRRDGHGDLVMALALALAWRNSYSRPSLIEDPSTLMSTWRLP